MSPSSNNKNHLIDIDVCYRSSRKKILQLSSIYPRFITFKKFKLKNSEVLLWLDCADSMSSVKKDVNTMEGGTLTLTVICNR